MKETKSKSTRAQVGLLFLGVGVLIVLNFFFINRANRITRIREASAQLVLRAISDVNRIGFYVSGKSLGIEEYTNRLTSTQTILEENMEFLEKGGIIIQNESAIKIPSLPGVAEDDYNQFKELWARYNASLDQLIKTPAIVSENFPYYQQTTVQTDSGYSIEYSQTSKNFQVLNEAMRVKSEMVLEDTGTLNSSLEHLLQELNDYYWGTRFGHQVATVLISILCVFALGFAIYIMVKNLFDPLTQLHGVSQQVAEGDLDCEFPENGYSEIKTLGHTLNTLVDRLGAATAFANHIGNGKFDTEFHVASKEDKLGYALLEMRDNLKHVAEEDRKRNWANEGMAKFGDILRSNYDSEEDLAYAIVSNLVQYLGVNQGGLFFKEQDNDNQEYLNLQAAYAYNRRKYLERRVDIGEGLVGQAVLEGQVIFLTEVPEDYAVIQSGMGEGVPRSVIILPLKLNGEVFGALELASFDVIEEYQIDFLKKISESITSTVSTSRTNQRTKLLLEDSQQMTEEMKAQEEEMRQNMEELQATQEEMARKQKELAQNDHRFRQMTQNVPGMIFQLQMNNAGTARFMFVSSASRDLLGVIPEEAVESPDHEEVLRLVAEDKDNYRKSMLDSAASLSALHWEGRITGEDGKSIKWISLSAQPERDDNDNVLWNGLIMDISEKKRAEEQMRVMIKQLEAKDAQVTENMEVLEQTKEELQFMNRELGAIMTSMENSVCVVELNKDLKVRKINEVVTKNLGYDSKSLARKEMATLFPDMIVNSDYFTLLSERLNDGQHVETYTKWKSSAGQEQWMHLLFFPSMNDKGKLLKFACLGTFLPDNLIPEEPMIL